MSSINAGIVIEHILETRSHLDIAIDVAHAHEEVRKRLIMKSMDSLTRRMREQLNSNEWTIDASLNDRPFDRYSGYFIKKKSWDSRCKIGFSAENADARGFIMGVQKGEEDLAAIHGLKAVLDDSIGHGLASSWWDWYYCLESPYADWHNKSVLLAMYDGSAAERLGIEMLRIASLAEPLIDTHLSDKSDSQGKSI